MSEQKTSVTPAVETPQTSSALPAGTVVDLPLTAPLVGLPAGLDPATIICQAMATAQASAIPPRKITRNEFGLINDGSVKYVYKPDGKVDWRKMIRPEFLVPNKERLTRAGIPIPATIDGLEDKYLLILLDGIKELAQLRGYLSVEQRTNAFGTDMVVSTCSITWTPNYETEGEVKTFSDSADACPRNTSKFGRDFLATIAANRAFVRAVRNFLGIALIGQDEVTDNSTAPDAEQMDVASERLLATMQEHGVSWEKIKAKLIEEKVEGAAEFQSVADIPKSYQLNLIGRIKKKAAERKAAAQS